MKKIIVSLVVVCAVLTPFLAPAQTTYEPYVFTTLAGNHPGYSDGTGAAARFDGPTDLAIDNMGNFFVADSDNDVIRKITPTGVVTTFAGLANSIGSADGATNAARFNRPNDLAFDSSNNLYVVDSGNNTVRKITPDGIVSTFAGSAGIAGSADGMATAARFNFPTGIAFDGVGNFYVADSVNNTIRKITASRVVSTFAGAAGVVGSSDGAGSAARFNQPRRVTLDNSGNLIVADTANHTIRKITAVGNVTTIAGIAGQHGLDDGPPGVARFYNPRGLVVDSSNQIYVANTSGGRIRVISPDGNVSTFVEQAVGGIRRPYGLALDAVGNLFVSDYFNHTIHKITPSATVSVFAGSISPGYVNSSGTNALFDYPVGPAVDSAGNIYVCDSNNDVIRKITSAGVVSTFAGSGVYGFADGDGVTAKFATPFSIAIDSVDNLYVADAGNNIIRKITPNAVVSTFAGSPKFEGSDDGVGGDARFFDPEAVAMDAAGNIYVADSGNYTIRKITTGAVVTTIAGLAGTSGSQDGTGGAARFDYPSGVAVDNSGNVYVSDLVNCTIRKITPAGVVTTFAGSPGMIGSLDGDGSAARFNYVWGVAVDPEQNVLVCDWQNHAIRKISQSGNVTTVAGIPGVLGWNDGAGDVTRFDYPAGLAVSGSGRIYIADSFNNSIRTGVPQLRLISAVSRKTHGAAGAFNIPMPLTGEPAVECRSNGGNHTIVFSFDNNMMGGNASVTSGIGSVSGNPTFSGSTMTVNLTGVADAQKITVTLTGATDTLAQVLPNTAVSLNILAGDASGNKSVNATDVSQTKLQSGAAVSATNFREDVVVSGSINATDVSFVKSHSGSSVP